MSFETSMEVQPVGRESQRPDYRARLDGILNRPLTPEIIDGYADGALEDVVQLVEDARERFTREVADDFASVREAEDGALDHYGLDGIGTILDHLTTLHEQGQALDKLIANAERLPSVIVPPDETDALPITSGNGSYEPARTEPRTKTVLFILANDFDVDPADPEQLQIRTGQILPDMVRRESYNLVQAPELGRAVLVCDETGNVTYVFDTAVMEEFAISGVDLTRLGKPDLNALLTEYPVLGKRVTYSGNYIPNMIAALGSPAGPETVSANGRPAAAAPDSTAPETMSSYLYPKAPDGVLSTKGLSRELGIDYNTTKRLISALQADGRLPEAGHYRFGTKGARGYSPEHQAIIHARAKATGLFTERPPEGVLSVHNMACEWGTTDRTVARAIQRLQQEGALGPATEYRFGSNLAGGYTTEQQAAIKTRLGVLLNAEAGVSDNKLSIHGMAQQWNISPETVKKYITELQKDGRLGPGTPKKFGGKVAVGFDPDKQKLISTYLWEKGVLADKAPEGVLSAYGIAKAIGRDQGIVRRRANSMEAAGTLGEVGVFRLNNKPAKGYTPDQMRIIIDSLPPKRAHKQ